MKRLSLVFVLAIIFTACVSPFVIFAQTEGVSETPLLSAEEFSVDFPAPPEGAVYTDKTLVETGRRFTLENGGTYFFVFSDSATTPVQSVVVLKFLQGYQKSAELPKDNLQKQKFSFKDEDGYYQQILMIKTSEQFYVFQTVSLKKDAPEAKRFFDSITFKQKNIAKTSMGRTKVNADTNNESSKNNPSTATQSNDAGEGPGNTRNENNSKITIGFGVKREGVAKSDEPAMLEEPLQNAPLKLLSKPRPPYTEFAVFYGIQGNVRLQTTFSADGSISDVKVVNALPFGLTEQAVKAAREIKFTPQIKQGQPYTSVKTVEYNFNIY